MRMASKKKVQYLAYSGLVLLRKAITLLDFIIANEATEEVRNAYTEKQKELKNRLKDREENKETVPSIIYII